MDNVPPFTDTTLMRVMLMKQEAYRVARHQCGLRVRARQAWVTLNGHDLVLKRGDEIAIEAKHDFAVVSALGCAPLVIEMLSETPRHSTRDLSPIVTALR
jgi:hypothetical protein